MRLFRKRIGDREIEAELRQHMEEMIAANRREGMTKEEATRVAMLEFGPMTGTTERCRDIRAMESLATFVRDLRFGARRLRLAPGFTAAVVLSLAIGIGSSSALFSLVSAAILRSIPVHRPDQLVWFDSGSHGRALNYPFYQEILQDPHFDGVLCAFPTSVNVSATGLAERTEAELVSANYFTVLGIQPHLGRFLTRADDRAPVAVVSHDFWQSRLRGASGIVGSTIRINGAAWTIVGVAPPGFSGLDRAYQRDLFVPMGMKPAITPGWNALDKPLVAWLYIAGRLKSSIDREGLGAELNARFQLFQETHLAQEKKLSPAQRQMIRGRHLRLEPLASAVLESRVADHIVTMGWIVGLLLSLACVNVAGLLLARGIERRRELATRLSIGASRGRIIGQLLTEALLLAIAGGAAGLAGAVIAAPLLATRFPLAGDGSKLDVPLDWTVLGFTFGVSLIACLLFGLAPAWQATKLDLVTALKGSMPTVSANRMRNVLLAMQAGVSVVLLCAAGLFTTNLRELLANDTGFDRHRLLLAELEPTLSGYDEAARLRLYAALEQRLQEVFPLVTLSNVAPMSPFHWGSLFLVKGRERTDDRPVRGVVVGANYFDTMRIPLRYGQLPDSRNRTAVISETLARLEFPNESPIGRRFISDLRQPEATTFEIVGVVADASLNDPRHRAHLECVYFSYRQWAFTPQAMVVQARLAPGLSVTVAADRLRQALRDVDPSLAFYDVRTIEQASESLLVSERLAALLTAFFGAAAALLFAVGMHGVVSRDLAARAKEAAIRVVLGGRVARVVWALARGPLLSAAIGLVAGVVLLAGIAPALSPLLTNVRLSDPVFVAAAAGILLLMAMAALAAPAWRVRNLQPAAVLKKE